MPFFTRLGEIWLMAIVIVPALYIADKRNFYQNLGLFAGALILSALVARILKYLVDRPRPLKDMANLIDAHRVYIHVIGKSLRETSFPSGHTVSAFSAATFLSGLFKRWALLFFSIAMLTGISRIYVGAHFPLDVLGGILIGTSITSVFCILINRYYFKMNDKS